jgi:hypothetical protein
MADVVGRRITLTVATAVRLGAVVLLGSATSFAQFAVATAMGATSDALVSGTDQARRERKQRTHAMLLLCSTIFPLFFFFFFSFPGKQALLFETLLGSPAGEFERATAVGSFLWPAAAAFSAMVGGQAGVHLALRLSALPLALAVVAALVLEEPRHVRRRSGVAQVVAGCRAALGQERLLCVLAFGALTHSFSETPHQLKPLFLRARGVPSQGIGMVAGVGFFLSSAGSMMAGRAVALLGPAGTLAACTVAACGMQLLACASTGLPASACLAAGSLLWGVQGPVAARLALQDAGADSRATVISLLALVRNLGVAVCAPVLASVAASLGIVSAFRSAAVCLLLALLPLARLQREQQDKGR